MKILFIPKDIPAEDMLNIKFEKLASTNLDLIKSDLYYIDNQYEFGLINIGKGVDYILFTVGLSIDSLLVTFGDEKQQNIDVWIKIGEKIKNILSKTQKIYIECDLAVFLSVEYLYVKYNTKNIILKDKMDFALEDLSSFFYDRMHEDFTAKPHSSYYFHFLIDNDAIEIINVRSDGKIISLEQYDNSSSDVFF